MKHVKSERLKKLESELTDLEEWLKLGLVPKKDVQKHKEEIESIKTKIEEEKERLQFLKESGEVEEYVTPKKNITRATTYTDMPTIPDVDIGDSAFNASDAGFDLESGSMSSESSGFSHGDDRGDDDEAATRGDEEGEEGEEEEEEEEESYFSERNRWKRGGIVDPEADEW